MTLASSISAPSPLRRCAGLRETARIVVVGTIWLGLATALAAAGRERPATAPAAATSAVDEIRETLLPAEGPAEGDEPAAAEQSDPCAATYLEGTSWVDWVHRAVFRSTCESALWFDNLFGTERVYQERDVTQGRIRLGVLWDEREGVEPIARFRVKFRFPQFEQRLSALVGRDDEEKIIEDRGGIGENLPIFFGDPDEDEWLVGLGYSPMRGSRNRFDFGVGARIGLPSEPYVNVKYRHHAFLSGQRLVRWRQTVFWESEDGFGTTTRYDLEKVLGPSRLVRWRSVGTVSESTRGVDWRSGISLFQRLGDERALAYQVGVFGETDAPVTIRDVGLRVIYRQTIFREWLFLDLRPGLAWRKETQEEVRKPLWGLGVSVEMRFGDS